MDILTTRVLTYANEGGIATQFILTIFVPQLDTESWKCGFAFPRWFHRENSEFWGGDFLQALLICLQMVPSYLRLAPLPNRAQWQGMHHCGLPSRAEQP